MNDSIIRPTSNSSAGHYLPPQPEFNAWCTGWRAYDVPRIYDILRPTNDDISWGQATGFRLLASKLLMHHITIREHRDRLALTWQGPAANLILARIDAFAEALLTDSHCASTTANALDSIMSTYEKARQRVRVLKTEWDRTTSIWRSFLWDSAAADLNGEAQKLMFAVDDAIRDHRSRITVPTRFLDHVYEDLQFEVPTDGEQNWASATRPIPPVPGYDPTLTAPPSGTQIGSAGQGLANLPVAVPAVPGQPISMLPIPPGNSYAPYGGAYVLPGPGVGSNGYVVPMPHPSQSTAGKMFTHNPTPSSGGGMMPMPFGTQPPKPTEGIQRVLYRRRSATWTIDSGVKPIIEAPTDDAYIPGNPSEKQEKAFLDWFSEIAYPWQTDQGRNDSPKIMFRRSEGE